MTRIHNIIGLRFGKLEVMQEVDRIILPCGQTNRAFLCRCECGKDTIVRLLHLIRNRIKSCGCANGEQHGMCKSRLYKIWCGIKNRCYGNKTIEPHLYKDKGIIMCDSWRYSFTAFNEWAINNGYKENLQIDRINNLLGYSPNNCRFVTPLEQASNRSVTEFISYHGKLEPFSFLLHKLNKFNHYAAIHARIKRGWLPEKAIDTPIREGNYLRGRVA